MTTTTGRRLARNRHRRKLNRSIHSFATYLEETKNIDVKRRFSIFSHFMQLIPSRIHLVYDGNQFYAWKYKGIFNKQRDAKDIVILSKDDLKLEKIKKANVIDRINYSKSKNT